MESPSSATLLVKSINTYRMGHRVSMGNQQIVNWDSEGLSHSQEPLREEGIDREFPAARN